MPLGGWDALPAGKAGGAGGKSVAEKARLERLEREARRKADQDSEKKDNAARTITRCMRTVASKSVAKKRLRSVWDGWTSFEPSATTTDIPSPTPLCQAWVFLRFYDAASDTARLAHCCKRLLVPPAPKASSLVLCRYLTEPEARPVAERVLRDLAQTCVIRVSGPEQVTKTLKPDSTYSTPYLSGPELRFLISYMDVKQYPTKAIAREIHSSLVGDGLFERWSSAILHQTKGELLHRYKHPGKANDTPSDIQKKTHLWLNAIMHISLMITAVDPDETPLPSDETVTSPSDDILLSFTLHILTTPLLTSFADAQCLAMLTRAQVLQRVSQAVAGNRNWRERLLGRLEGEQALYLAGNLVELYRRVEGSTKVVAAGEEDPHRMWALSILCQHASNYVSEKATNLVTYHPIFKWYSGKPNPTIPSDFLNLLVTQLSHLWSRPFLLKTFSLIISFTPSPPPSSAPKKPSFLPSFIQPTPQPTNNPAMAMLTADLKDKCELYLALSETILAHRVTIMNGLSYTPGLVPGLWRVLGEVGPRREGVGLFLDAVEGGVEKEPLMGVLRLFCEIGFALFITLDDEELYTTQHPFTLPELTTLQTFLTEFTFRLYYTHPLPHPPIATTTHRLLSLLHDRSIRRPFSDAPMKLSYLPKEITSSQCITLIQNRDARASLVLSKVPQCVPFKTRVEIFRWMVGSDRGGGGEFGVKVRRGRALEDGFAGLGRVGGAALRGRIRVKYVNQFGLEEVGIDQNGVFKEFLEDTIKQAFSPSLSLFRTTPNGNVVPSPSSSVQPDHLELFQFVGKLLGKALYDGIVIDIPFALFVYTKMLGRWNFLDELPSLDPQLYKNLTFLKHYEGDCEDLGLTFTIDQDMFGEIVTKEIKPGGTSLPVTNDTKFEYIHLMADYRLNKECKAQFAALIGGFRSVVTDKWVGFFDSAELRK
ncbi:Ubiquitin-protein ligase E3B [Rhizophlyctis rosea]|nr:Ubiquitin-protein ligase E3B [Rhizophlyctis rosea]